MIVFSPAAVSEWRSHWLLPVAAAFGYATAVIHVYSIGPFMHALTEEFGWSRAQASAGITVASIASAILCIPMGMLVDRIGPRRIALFGVVLMTGAFALLGAATGAVSQWLALWGVIAVGTLGVQATVWTSAVASRFDASRGLAFAVTLSGASVAATVFPVLATALIGAYGWRTAFPAMGALWLALVLPVLIFFFRGAQDGAAGTRKASTANLPGLTLGEGLRTGAFWRLVLASALFTFAAIGAVVHFVPILKDSGAQPLAAAGIASLVGIFSVIGRLGTGFLLDRFPAHQIGAVAFLLPVFASGLLLLDGSNPFFQSVAAAAFGLTVGSEIDVIAYLAARHFGLKNFGALYGALIMALALGTAFGPLAAGALHDNQKSYDSFLMLAMAMLAASSVVVFTLKPAAPVLQPEKAAA